MAFQFYAASDEEQERLRNNPEQCLMFLQACKALATKLATVAGIYTPLTEEDEEVLQSFHLVQQAYPGYEHEGKLDELCSRAGLLPSDTGLLVGRVETLFHERQPTIYQAEAIALMEEWLHEQDA